MRLATNTLFPIILLATLFFLIILNSDSLSIEPIIFLFCIILFGLFCIQIHQQSQKRFILISLFIVGIILALYGVLQYIQWLPSTHSVFSITGPFDNPAGFAITLTLIFPMGLFLLLAGKRKSYPRYLLTGGLLLIFLAIALCRSRAGILSVIISSVLLVALQTNIVALAKNKFRMIVTGSLMLLGLFLSLGIALYKMNMDSSNGRLLIWRVSSEMVMDKPLLGHGNSGFLANYMDYQAEYFQSYPASSFRQLADNVKHPFNEFIRITVEQGILGLLVTISILVVIFKKGIDSRKSERFLCISGMTGGIIFALFSYPLHYMPVWVILVFYFSLILDTKEIRLQNTISQILAKASVMILSISFLVITLNTLRAKIAWNTIAQNSLAGKTQAMLPEYGKLYHTLKENPLFLYNYGAELHVAQKYDQSIIILNECQRKFNSYDLQRILAENHEKKGDLEKAKRIYRHLSNMIPTRFWPLYKLVQIYKKRGEMDKAVKLAEKISKKKAKVPSSTVSSIKYRMKIFLDSTDYQK